MSGQVSAQTPSRSFTASGSAIDCPENIIYAGPPGPVQSLAVNVATPLQATLTFQPPADDGGSPIRWYEVSTDGGSTWSTITATPDGNNTVTHVVNSLSAGSVTFDVRAVNLLGNGPATAFTGTVVATTTTTATTTSTTAPTTSTTAPTTTTVVPVTDGNGDLPDLDPGDTEVTDDGNPVDVDVEVVDDTEIKVSSNDGVVLNLSGNCGGPCPVKTGSNGKPYLVMEDTGQVRVSGSGFQAGSTVHVWVLPGQTYLGPALVGNDGSFDRSFAVNAAPGEHTVQVNGITQTGASRSANLGLVVNAGSGSGQLPNTGASMGYAYLGFALLAAGAVSVGLVRVVGSNLEAKRNEA